MDKKLQELRMSQFTSYEEARKLLGREPLTADHFNFLADEREQKRAGAHQRLETINIALKLNEDGSQHEFDWNDTDENKYYPYFDMETYEGQQPGSGFAFRASGFDYDFAYLGARLYFRSRELSDYSGKQFEDIYRDWIRG